MNQRHFELGGCDSGPEMFSSAFSNTHLVEAEILSMASKHAGMDWDSNVYEQLHAGKGELKSASVYKIYWLACFFFFNISTF